MSDKRINVLVHSGTGASPSAVQHALHSLKQHLSPNYAVLTISPETLLNEPWSPTCALLVFPGGGDLGYCRSLNGSGNKLIRQYVEAGGRYLGLCAGGYYGSSKCEFEVGNRAMEVIGERELGFFPGTCRGSAYGGFEYESDRGTRAARLDVDQQLLQDFAGQAKNVSVYANGGGYFLGATGVKEVEVLATYDEEVDVEHGDEKPAAVVYAKVGAGAAVLTGPHPEFAISNISSNAKGLSSSVYERLRDHDANREIFFRALLSKLGLEVAGQSQQAPPLAPLHLVSPQPGVVEDILKRLEDVASTVDGDEYVKGEADTFLIKQPGSPWDMTSLTRAALDVLSFTAATLAGCDAKEASNERGHATPPNHSNVIKTIITHSHLPTRESTPQFDHAAYFTSLSASKTSRSNFGNPLLTTACTTSTSTLLSSNPTLTSRLPDGTTFTAATQLSGRGRGNNVWVSPPGALMFTTVFAHTLELNAKAPVVFVQYLAAMAVVEAVTSYGFDGSSAEGGQAHDRCSYDEVPVRLKWPNDIYALDARHVGEGSQQAREGWREKYTKIGGILVNTSYSGGSFTVILGIGLNLSNAAPTTSLNTLINAMNAQRPTEKHLQPMTQETLLAKIMSCFGRLYDTFSQKGFAGELEGTYKEMWLHKDQIVMLETEGGAQAMIKGVSTDWGLLVAEEIGLEGKLDGAGSGRRFALQSDSNSFDFFKGLLKRKL